MTTSITLREIAAHINAELRGEANIKIIAIAPLALASANELSFIVEKKHLAHLQQSRAAAIILSPQLVERWSGNALVVANPYLAYAKAAELFAKVPAVRAGIHSSAVVGDNSNVAASASIGAHVVLGNNVFIGKNTVIAANVVVGDDCRIGANCQLKANVTLCDDVVIGDRCIIHNGAVIGCDGFGNANVQGHWHKIPQLGGVRLGDDIEVGANSTIDCGTLGDTVIETGVRIDNLVHIAHNVHVGAHTAIAAGCGIAGSTKIGKYCMLAGQVGIVGHLRICDNVVFTARAMVTSSVSQPGVYSSGTGLMPQSAWQKSIVHFRHFDKLVKKIRQVEKIQKGTQ